MENWPKICPIFKTSLCLKKECAWWDRSYNCCAILSSAILLETLVKRKSRYWPKKEEFFEKAEENTGGK
ncbi:MAG: hypothetical protein ISS45_07615 [Candidatus Omnitrophica bacterium]|nr:hypothetical protein [Candidatus Omnitrophota bacterium]